MFQILFQADSSRKEALIAILDAQGFVDQLDQYEIEISQIDCIDTAYPVRFGRHRTTGDTVAIKCIDTATYKRLKQENGISEGAAMKLCKSSPHVAQLAEEFRHGEQTFLVSKFVKGGDLLAYL